MVPQGNEKVTIVRLKPKEARKQHDSCVNSSLKILLNGGRNRRTKRRKKSCLGLKKIHSHPTQKNKNELIEVIDNFRRFSLVNCLQCRFLIASDNLKIANTLKISIVKAYKGFKIIPVSLDGTVKPYATAVDDSEQIPFDCEVFPRHLFIEQVTRLTRSYFSLIALKFCNQHIYSIYNFLFLLIVLKMFPTYLSVDLPARRVASKQKDVNWPVLYSGVTPRSPLSPYYGHT